MDAGDNHYIAIRSDPKAICSGCWVNLQKIYRETETPVIDPMEILK